MKTKPNNHSSIPPHILHSLKRKLRRRCGFNSYKSIQLWLQKCYSLCVLYSTVHGIVRYSLKAKLKVGRRSHVKRDERDSIAFKENMSAILMCLKPLSGADEPRTGESFFRTFKQRYRRTSGFCNINVAVAFCILFVVYYNFFRPHTRLDGETPVSLLENHNVLQNWQQLIHKALKAA